MKNILIIFFGIAAIQFFSFTANAQGIVNKDVVSVVSPTGISKATLELYDGDLYWTVSYKKMQVLKRSKLGIVLKKRDLKKPFNEVSLKQYSKDTIWKPVWGKFSTVHNNYLYF